MTFPVKRFLCALLAGCFAFSGCLRAPQALSDEEKEPHFLEGKSRVNSMDYPGAVESFENALEVNPRSAAAHFELGWLSDQKESDPAAAIYYYSRYLKLRPDGENAERARTRIVACKQELARTVALGPITQTLQRESDQLAEENRRLKEELEQWRAYYKAGGSQPQVNQQAAATAGGRPAASLASAQPLAADRTAVTLENSRYSSQGAVSAAGNRTSNPEDRTAGSTAARTHTVKSGETPSAIARKYGVKVDALLAANPRLDARHLQIGQALAIPSSRVD